MCWGCGFHGFAQLELAIELVDDRLPSISEFNDLNGHATETTHYTHFTLTGQVQGLPLRTFQIFLGDSNCWVVRTWEDLELVINPYKVGPAEILTWRVWPYFSASGLLCKTQLSAKKHFVAFFTHFNCPWASTPANFLIESGLFSLWHCNNTQDSKDVFVLGSIEDITVALEDSLVTISTIVPRSKMLAASICYIVS